MTRARLGGRRPQAQAHQGFYDAFLVPTPKPAVGLFGQVAEVAVGMFSMGCFHGAHDVGLQMSICVDGFDALEMNKHGKPSVAGSICMMREP